MIKKHYSLVHADKVLRLLQRSRKLKEIPVCLDNWSNGREQGYSLWVDTFSITNRRRVNFAQARNSDEIIVLAGKPDKFDITTNMPSGEIWPRRRYFKDDRDAAEAIIFNLISGQSYEKG